MPTSIRHPGWTARLADPRDRARCSLRGIDEQVAKAEKAVASGLGLVKRNRNPEKRDPLRSDESGSEEHGVVSMS
jgi:hypothetical protein